LSFISHTAVNYVHFTLAPDILDFWWMSTSRDTGVAPLKSMTRKTWGW